MATSDWMILVRWLTAVLIGAVGLRVRSELLSRLCGVGYAAALLWFLLPLLRFVLSGFAEVR